MPGNHTKDSKHFHKDYVITERVLGAGAYGRVHMAVEQSRGTQLACKVVDLRKLQQPSRMTFGRWEQPAAAEDVDSRLQLAKVKSWVKKQKKDNQLGQKLKTYYREVDILASLNHVRILQRMGPFRAIDLIMQPNIIGLEKVYITDNSM